MIKLLGKVRSITDANGHSVQVSMMFAGKDKENQVAIHPDSQMTMTIQVMNEQSEMFAVNKPVSVSIDVPEVEAVTKKK